MTAELFRWLFTPLAGHCPRCRREVKAMRARCQTMYNHRWPQGTSVIDCSFCGKAVQMEKPAPVGTR